MTASPLMLLKLTTKEVIMIRRIITKYKIPVYSTGYALCYYQDLGISSFQMFCLCLLIAHKFNEDYKIRSSCWSRCTNIDKRWLIDNEIKVLKHFKHEMHLPYERVAIVSFTCMKAFYPSKKSKYLYS